MILQNLKSKNRLISIKISNFELFYLPNDHKGCSVIALLLFQKGADVC